MGLFNFFKKKASDNKLVERQPTVGVDYNFYLFEMLKNRLIELGYQVDKHPQYLALVVNSEIEIATVIIDKPGYHSGILHLRVLTIQPKYFAKGIKENIVGVGITIEDKAKSVIDNYINSTFIAIMDSFSDSHNPDLDFFTLINDKEVLWHPKMGNLMFQGQWDNQPEDEPLFKIIKGKLKDKLTLNKLNWLKMYISKQADGTIIGECAFNNESWDDGLRVLTEYAKSWEEQGNFQELKQFIMFRKCDAYDG